jgi:hypothetical protein
VNERNVVRLSSGVVAAVSVVLPLLMWVSERLPSTAMGSALLLYLKRALAVCVILLFLFLYRSLVHGELPRISGRGAEWSDLVASSGSTTSELQTQVDELDAAMKRMLEALEAER